MWTPPGFSIGLQGPERMCLPQYAVWPGPHGILCICRLAWSTWDTLHPLNKLAYGKFFIKFYRYDYSHHRLCSFVCALMAFLGRLLRQWPGLNACLCGLWPFRSQAAVTCTCRRSVECAAVKLIRVQAHLNYKIKRDTQSNERGICSEKSLVFLQSRVAR
jgi:hypothetical protein